MRIICGGVFLLATNCSAGWPFGGDDSGGGGGGGINGGPMPIRFGGPGGPGGGFPMPNGGMLIPMRMAPMIVSGGHFGVDPWEDLHKNMERAVSGAHRPGRIVIQMGGGRPGMPSMLGNMLGAPGDSPGGSRALAPLGGGGDPMSLESQLGNLLGLFGGLHQGQVGRSSGSFEVDDDHLTRFRITGSLPGYHLGDNTPLSESPLNVRMVGHRSVVISGTQQTGPIIRSWQRSFPLPKGVDVAHVDVKYSSTSGNLTIDVPRKNHTDGEEDEDEDEDDADLPPALRAMRNGLPGMLSAGQGGPPRGGGFLAPPDDFDPLAQIMGMMGGFHPRFQPPEGGERKVPQSANVEMVGCFSESQLSKNELKYYSNKNAASFNAMYWHAKADHTEYFAMSRHLVPMGHGVTVHAFAHENEIPRWGTDACGSRCADDPTRSCGCANERTRGWPNDDCEEGEDEKRYAVYKIGEETPGADSGSSGASAHSGEDESEVVPGGMSVHVHPESTTAAAPTVSAAHTFKWELVDASKSADGAPAIEIAVPKGTVARTEGRSVLLYSPSAFAPKGADAAALGVDADAPSQPPLGKVKLPSGVSPEACSTVDGKTSEDGGEVITCSLRAQDVQNIPIKVVDEL